MNKHFDMFKTTEKKEITEKVVKLEDDKDVKKIKGFTYIPGSAFEAISAFPHYADLETGLYVAKKKMTKRQALDGGESMFHNYEVSNGGYLLVQSYFNASSAVAAVKGKMLTLAEYFCVVDYLDTTKKDKTLLKDMTIHGEEFLDDYVKVKDNDTKNDELICYAPVHHEKGSLNFDNSYDLTIFNFEYGFFNKHMLDEDTGFPTRIRDTRLKGNLEFYMMSFHMDDFMTEYAFQRSAITDGSEKVPCISLDEVGHGKQTGVRACYTKRMIE